MVWWLMPLLQRSLLPKAADSVTGFVKTERELLLPYRWYRL